MCFKKFTRYNVRETQKEIAILTFFSIFLGVYTDVQMYREWIMKNSANSLSIITLTIVFSVIIVSIRNKTF